jgi:hypothetical protein
VLVLKTKVEGDSVMNRRVTHQDFTSTFLVNELVKNATALLAGAQVAVKPIDACGLPANPAFDASRSGERYGRSPTAFAQDVTRFQSGLAQEHSTESIVAEESGGHAFFNTNSLASAANAAIDDGYSYIDDPARGESYLRIGVHDLKANHLGVIEVPVASLPHTAAALK